MNLLYVAIGGAAGSTARYLLAGAINQARAPHAAAGTFAVNVIGCFTFGILLAISEHRGALSSSTGAFPLVGVLGGFTTFSSYAYETFVMLREAHFCRPRSMQEGRSLSGC
jgi:fluoride exporter